MSAPVSGEPRTILTIDVGNTSTKLGVFEGERLVQSVAGTGLGAEALEALLDYYTPDGFAYCCVGADTGGLRECAEATGLPFVAIEAATSVPLEIEYGSPATLGSDRIAAAAGSVGEGGSAFVVDVGTAVTADLIVGGRFIGGNISPGLGLRFRSLAEHTSRLPLVGAEGELPEFGTDTDTAIRSGIVRGLIAELKNDFETAKKYDSNIRMVLTGGDAAIIAPLLESCAVAAEVVPDAVGIGMVRIFNFNYPI